jgi:hypothetical protein
LQSGLNQADVPGVIQIPKQIEEVPTLEEEINDMALAAAMAEAEGYEQKDLADTKRRPEWPLWKEAMEKEIKTLEELHTWKLRQTSVRCQNCWMRMGLWS